VIDYEEVNHRNSGRNVGGSSIERRPQNDDVGGERRLWEKKSYI